MMSAPRANLINAIVLIAMSAWAFAVADTRSFTILIPAMAGVILLACQPGVNRQSKAIAHIAVLVTLLILVALIMALTGSISRGDPLAIGRVAAMMLTSLIAMIAFVRSFIAARKA